MTDRLARTLAASAIFAVSSMVASCGRAESDVSSSGSTAAAPVGNIGSATAATTPGDVRSATAAATPGDVGSATVAVTPSPVGEADRVASASAGDLIEGVVGEAVAVGDAEWTVTEVVDETGAIDLGDAMLDGTWSNPRLIRVRLAARNMGDTGLSFHQGIVLLDNRGREYGPIEDLSSSVPSERQCFLPSLIPGERLDCEWIFGVPELAEGLVVRLLSGEAYPSYGYVDLGLGGVVRVNPGIPTAPPVLDIEGLEFLSCEDLQATANAVPWLEMGVLEVGVYVGSLAMIVDDDMYMNDPVDVSPADKQRIVDYLNGLVDEEGMICGIYEAEPSLWGE